MNTNFYSLWIDSTSNQTEFIVSIAETLSIRPLTSLQGYGFAISGIWVIHELPVYDVLYSRQNIIKPA